MSQTLSTSRNSETFSDIYIHAGYLNQEDSRQNSRRASSVSVASSISSTWSTTSSFHEQVESSIQKSKPSVEVVEEKQDAGSPTLVRKATIIEIIKNLQDLNPGTDMSAFKALSPLSIPKRDYSLPQVNVTLKSPVRASSYALPSRDLALLSSSTSKYNQLKTLMETPPPKRPSPPRQMPRDSITKAPYVPPRPVSTLMASPSIKTSSPTLLNSSSSVDSGVGPFTPLTLSMDGEISKFREVTAIQKVDSDSIEKPSEISTKISMALNDVFRMDWEL